MIEYDEDQYEFTEEGLLEAIAAHQSRESEASSVIRNFNDLSEAQKQDVLNFLRSL